MKRLNSSEKLLIEELTVQARQARAISRGLSIGLMIKMLRSQFGISQKILARRACVPQSTVSRIEQGAKDMNLSTLQKLLNAMYCDPLILPLLYKSIDEIRQAQAKKQAEKRIQYLKGTMSLEAQEPDTKMLEELVKREQECLLHGAGSKLWEDKYEI